MSNSARDFNTVVTDYAMFDAARKIREWLWQISGLIKRLNEDLNPYYGCTQDGLVLLMAEIRDKQGCYGPVWGITKDLDGQALPAPVWIRAAIGTCINSVGCELMFSIAPDTAS